jgi:hypothetical protein
MNARSAEVPDWVRKLGITDRPSGQEQARASWNALISAGRRVLGTGMDYRVEHLVFSGFLARAQGLHEAAVAAIRADNPYAAFTLLRAYAENVAAILYVKDHPTQLDKFWRELRGPGVQIGRITNHAVSRFPGFKGIYGDLSRYAHPQALSMLASNQVVGDREVQWRSAPAFKSDHEAVIACAWVVELAQSTAQLLVEFAREFALLPGAPPGPAAGLQALHPPGEYVRVFPSGRARAGPIRQTNFQTACLAPQCRPATSGLAHGQ